MLFKNVKTAITVLKYVKSQNIPKAKVLIMQNDIFLNNIYNWIIIIVLHIIMCKHHAAGKCGANSNYFIYCRVF